MSEAVVSTGSGYRVRLKNRRVVADRTMAFELERPAGFVYKPGQSADLTLLDPPETDAKGNVRSFSIASAPGEPSLLFATRMRDTAFKRTLAALPLGAEVKMEGPFGNLVLHNNPSRPAVLIAGGIGITPFRGMVMQAAEAQLPHRIWLFYSNHRPEDAAFLDELQALEQKNLRYRLIATMTALEGSNRPWQGETGRIGKAMLAKYLADAANAVYYVAGPPGMVAALRAVLNDAGVDDDDIRAEEFPGY